MWMVDLSSQYWIVRFTKKRNRRARMWVWTWLICSNGKTEKTYNWPSSVQTMRCVSLLRWIPSWFTSRSSYGFSVPFGSICRLWLVALVLIIVAGFFWFVWPWWLTKDDSLEAKFTKVGGENGFLRSSIASTRFQRFLQSRGITMSTYSTKRSIHAGTNRK